LKIYAYIANCFNSPERLVSAQYNCGSSSSGYALLVPLEEGAKNSSNKEIQSCPETTPRGFQEQKRTWKFSHGGWRSGVTLNACITALVLTLNLVLTVWVSFTFPMDGGYSTLILGDCNEVSSWALWLHLAINVLSTILLGASNYTMQCLLAPTRREVDKAHRRGREFSIGFGETLNLLHIGWNRKVIYILLVISSGPLHLL
jgi:hypothetical protein